MDLRTIERQLRTLVGKPRPERLTMKIGPGVEARIDRSGLTTFSLRYKVQGSSTQRRVHLGTYTGNAADRNSMTPAEALVRAQALRAQARDGVDVGLEAQRGSDAAPVTVSDLCDRFLADHSAHLGKQHERAIRRDIASSIKPAKIGNIVLGSVRITDIRKSDLAALVSREFSRRTEEGLHAAATIASIRATLRSIFGFAEESGWLPANPAAGLRAPKGAVLTERERTLTDEELSGLWRLLTVPGRGAKTEGQKLKRAALVIIILTGARASEVLNRRRRDFDLNAATMVITDGKTDASNRTVPLSPVALQTVMDVLAATPANPDALLFPARGKDTATGSATFAREVADIVEALDHDTPHEWTCHDLRRSFVSWMEGEGGVPTEVVRRLVGHAARDVHSRVYDRSARLEDMKSAVLAYEKHVSSLAAPQGGNVVSITRGKSA
jgi:integrase